MNITATRITLILAAVLVVLSAVPTPVISQTVPDPQVLYFPIMSNVRTAWIGPTGGTITALAASPSNPYIIYAGSWGAGVFKSIDGGSTWKPASTGLKNNYIQAIAVDPKNPDVLYTGTYKYKLYKSSNGGASWNDANNGIQAEPVIYSIAIDPKNSNILYISTRGKTVYQNNVEQYNGVIYKSIDGGQNWSAVHSGVTGSKDYAYEVAVSPNNSNRIYAAYHQNGPVRSTNAGNTWDFIGSGASPNSRSLLIFPTSGQEDIAWMGAWTTNLDPGGVYINWAADSSGSWNYLANELREYDIYRIHQNPYDYKTILLATHNNGVLLSRDQGRDWDPAGLGYQRIYAVTSIGYSTFLAGTTGSAVQLTDDAGANWTQMNDGLTGALVTGVTTSPTDDQLLYASTIGSGVFRSEDNGKNWEQYNSNLPGFYIHDITARPGTSQLYALTDSNGLYTLDASISWNWMPTSTGLPAKSSDTPFTSFQADRPLSGMVAPEEEEINRQADTVSGPGTLAADASTYKTLLTLVFAPSNSQIAYLGIGAGGIAKSTNGGTQWIQTGMDPTLSAYSIAVHPADPNRAIAATSTNDIVKGTSDGGASWASYTVTGSTGPVYSVAYLPTDPETPFVGTASGLYRWSGSSFTLSGLPGLTVTALGTHPARPQMILAGTTSGAYRSMDGGTTWQSYPSQIDNIGIQTIDFDQAAGGSLWVYYGTSDHGILRDQYN